ncbi:MAG TPA: DinB family protein [Candidatus Limnocylindrales bacterium]|nr:DinB family protein [Candidatus Limnocylindrales bacterium]
MRLDDIRFLFGYDRWATRRLLAVIDGVPEEVWGATGVVGDRGLGAILVHQLGAHQRWRLGLGGDDEAAGRARPEREALPAPDDLARAWAAEWDALEAWLDTLDDAWLEQRDENVPYWQMLVHLANHGTQHRAEAASLLTAVGRSPGDLDMIFYAGEIAREGG